MDPPERSRRLAQQLGVRFPLLSDPDLRAAAAYGVADPDGGIAIPAVIVVRPDRKIAWKYVGERASDRPRAEQILDVLTRLRDARR